MAKKIRLGIIGLGERGGGLLKILLTNLAGAEITALCDTYPDRLTGALQTAEAAGFKPFITADYREIINKKAADAVYVATSWNTHTPITVDFLKAGIAVGMEVGAALSIAELWELVVTQEKTRTPFMFMENCCYDKCELLATSMARAGLFGEIVYASGAYGHDLRDQITGGNINRHYRLKHYIAENRDNYPTHELGPIARLLDINRGNRMTTLVSMASKAAGLREYLRSCTDGREKELANTVFRQGDIVDTLITCENGELIRLQLDTTLPRAYSRAFTVRGTKGMYSQDLNHVHLDGMDEGFDTLTHNMKIINNAAPYEEKYLPAIWKNITEAQRKSGHGGMDGFMFNAFINALISGGKMPIDVYDAAAWMSISCLSEQSVAAGGAPVQIPDFTQGAYKTRPREDVTEF